MFTYFELGKLGWVRKHVAWRENRKLIRNAAYERSKSRKEALQRPAKRDKPASHTQLRFRRRCAIRRYGSLMQARRFGGWYFDR